MRRLYKFLFSYKGRYNRARWWFHLLCFGVSGYIGVRVDEISESLLVIFALPLLLIMYSLIPATIKRLHDINLSGWWCLFYIIPLIGEICAIVVCGCLSSTVGENRYGKPTLPFFR